MLCPILASLPLFWDVLSPAGEPQPPEAALCLPRIRGSGEGWHRLLRSVSHHRLRSDPPGLQGGCRGAAGGAELGVLRAALSLCSTRGAWAQMFLPSCSLGSREALKPMPFSAALWGQPLRAGQPLALCFCQSPRTACEEIPRRALSAPSSPWVLPAAAAAALPGPLHCSWQVNSPGCGDRQGQTPACGLCSCEQGETFRSRGGILLGRENPDPLLGEISFPRPGSPKPSRPGR